MTRQAVRPLLLLALLGVPACGDDIPAVGLVDAGRDASREERSALAFRCVPDGQDNALRVNIHLQEKRAG